MTETLSRPQHRAMKDLLNRAARRYVSGPEVADAVRTAQMLRGRGLSCTFGYWDSGTDAPADVARQALDAGEALRSCGIDGYVSVKSTAFAYDASPLRSAGSTHVHIDAMGFDSVDPTFDFAAELPGAGLTLPGRWHRSDRDALTAVEMGRPVRVVKGQFPGFADDRDPAHGFLSVIDILAGRAPFVAVASHDVPLAAEALRRLRRAGTPCELQLLYGLPIERVLRQTGETTARVYVPFGNAYVPYALRRLRENPKALFWFALDLAFTDRLTERISSRSAARSARRLSL